MLGDDFQIEKVQKTTSINSSKVYKIIFMAVVVIIYTIILVGSTYKITRDLTEKNLKGALTTFHNQDSPTFLNLKGSVTGNIVDIKGDKAWVETDRGGRIILSIADPVAVQEFSGTKLIQLGTSVDEIKLNQTAMINISGYRSGYTITSVTYTNVKPVDFQAPEDATEPARFKAKDI